MTRLLIVILVAGCTSTTLPSASPARPATVLLVSGSGSAMRLTESLSHDFERTHPEIDLRFLPGTNSGGAIRAVVDGALEIAVVNRGLDPEEAAEAVEYTPFARDSVVFAANIDDSRLSLTKDQLRAIYAGHVADWASVGATSESIIVLDRDPDETMRKTMLMDLMAGTPVDPRATVLTSTGDMIDAIADIRGAIGYATLSAFRIADKPGLTVLEIDGAAPDPTTLVSGDYPWSATFGFVVRADAGPAERTFLEWVRDSSTEVLAKYGVAPYGP